MAFIFLLVFIFSFNSYSLDKNYNDLEKRLSILEKEKMSFGGRIFSTTRYSNQDYNTYDKLGGDLSKNNRNNLYINHVKFYFLKKINDNLSSYASFKTDSSKNVKPNEFYLTYKLSNFDFNFGLLSAALSIENENSATGTLFMNTTKYYSVGSLFAYNGFGASINAFYDKYGFYFGIFGNNISDNKDEKDVFNNYFRFYYNPYILDNNLIHIAFSYYNKKVKYKNDLIPIKIDNYIEGKNDNILYTIGDFQNLALDFAVNYNSFNFQSEFNYGFVKPSASGYSKYFGIYNYYLQTSYVLTGESIQYKKGHFTCIDGPKNSLDNGGFGAWELAFRFSKTDMSDRKKDLIFDYGKYTEYSMSLMWTPIQNIKLIFGYSKVFENYFGEYITSLIGKKNNNYDLFGIKFKLFF